MAWIAGGVVASFLILWYVVSMPAVSIASVNVQGASLAPADGIKAIAENELKGAYLLVIPRHNSFLYPGVSIEKAIEKEYPPIASVAVSRNGLNTLDIAVSERVPVALWCDGDAVAADTGETCFDMDRNGFVFTSAAGDASSTSSLVRYQGDLSGSPIGKTYLSGGFAPLSALITDIATSIGRAPESVSIPQDTDDVYLTLQGGGVIRFVRTADPGTTLQNIVSVFSSDDFKSHSSFQYIDFRFGNKVYVKYE